MALTNCGELENLSQGDSTAKDSSFEERNEPSTFLNQVNGGEEIIHEGIMDKSIGDSAFIPPKSPHSKQYRTKVDGDGSPTGVASPSSMKHAGDGASRESAPIVQASPSVPIEILSSDSSSPEPRSDPDPSEYSDQESDNASNQESDSFSDKLSDAEQSNAAVYSGPASDYGLDGSTFSRPQPSADFAAPPGVITRVEEGLDAHGRNVKDARDIPSSLRSDVDQIESQAEEPSYSKTSVTDSLFYKDEESEEDFDTLEGHDAAQRRSSIQTPSEGLGSPEARNLDDEAMKGLATAQLLTSDGGLWVDTGKVEDEIAMLLSSRKSPSSSNHESQEELVLRSPIISGGEVAVKVIHAKTPVGSPGRKSPSISREKFDSSAASDKEDTLETSPEKGPCDSTERQKSPTTYQQDIVSDAKMSSEKANVLFPQAREDRNGVESLSMVASKIQQTTVEIIDLESDDEDSISPQNKSPRAVEVLVDGNDSKLAPTHKMTAYGDPLPLASDADNEHHSLVEEADSLSTLLVFKPSTAVEEIRPTVIHVKPEAHEDALEPERASSRTLSPVARIEGNREDLRLINEIPLPQWQEISLNSKSGELPSEEEKPFKQSATIETKLRPIHTHELPATIHKSLDDVASKSQFLTPSSTQQTNVFSQSSSVSFHSAPEDDTLTTPRLTQGTSAGIVPPQPFAPPEEPTLKGMFVPPKKTTALIERLKEMRRRSIQSPKPRSSDASILDPWFAPRPAGQVVPDSEDGSEAESSPERKVQANVTDIVGRLLSRTPEKSLAKSFIRSPSQQNHISSIQSSPQYLPPFQPPPPGFRTKLSYFVPLATLTSHFATTVDVLAIALSGTPVTRATSGPRDYNQTLYITDPSSSVSQHSITTAQIFRPNNRCFPLVEKGEALLLRDFKVQPFQKRLLLLSTESSAWAVFRKGADVQIHGPPVEFGAEERGFARGLWDWWASIGNDARKRLENAVPEYKKPKRTAKTAKSKPGEKKSDTPSKKEEIEGLGVDLPGSQSKGRGSTEERSLALDGVDEKDMVQESIEAPRRVLRARGARGVSGRSESARESRFGTVFTGGLGEPDETQGSAHELRDGKAYRAKGR